MPAREIEARERRARLGTGVAALDELLGGGWPRGAVSELCGGRGQGRTGVLLATLAAAMRREETVALLDLEGAFDPWAARRAGIRLDRLLWVRGTTGVGWGGGRALREGGERVQPGSRALPGGGIARGGPHQRMLAAAEAIVAAGGFGLVALDMGDWPASVPSAAWLRLRRAAGAPGTVVLVVTGRPLAGAMGAAAVNLQSARPSFQDGLLTALESQAQLVRQIDGGVRGPSDGGFDGSGRSRGRDLSPALRLRHEL